MSWIESLALTNKVPPPPVDCREVEAEICEPS